MDEQIGYIRQETITLTGTQSREVLLFGAIGRVCLDLIRDGACDGSIKIHITSTFYHLFSNRILPLNQGEIGSIYGWPVIYDGDIPSTIIVIENDLEYVYLEVLNMRHISSYYADMGYDPKEGF